LPNCSTTDLLRTPTKRREWVIRTAAAVA
jgi:hypothetical protein